MDFIQAGVQSGGAQGFLPIADWWYNLLIWWESGLSHIMLSHRERYGWRHLKWWDQLCFTSLPHQLEGPLRRHGFLLFLCPVFPRMPSSSHMLTVPVASLFLLVTCFFYLVNILPPARPPRPTKHYKVRPRNDVTMLFPFSLARKSSCSLFLLGTVCLRSPYRRGAKLRRTVTSCLPAQTHQGAKWEKYFKKHSYSSLRFWQS